MVSLRPYPEAELEAMWVESVERYFGDLRANGGLSEDEARAKVEQDKAWLRGLERLLVYEIEHEGARVGRVVLWLDAFEKAGSAWLFEIVLDESVRGRGFGREALRLAEEIQEPQLLFPCYDGLASLHLDLGDEAQAEQYLLRGQQICQQAGLDPDSLVVLPFLS
jgi:GNAT superfamily N-acetyltransferase